MKIRNGVAVGAVLLGFAFAPGWAEATRLYPDQLWYLVKRADAIFVGRVTGLSDTERLADKVATVEVLEIWAGQPVSKVKVAVGRSYLRASGVAISAGDEAVFLVELTEEPFPVVNGMGYLPLLATRPARQVRVPRGLTLPPSLVEVSTPLDTDCEPQAALARSQRQARCTALDLPVSHLKAEIMRLFELRN